MEQPKLTKRQREILDYIRAEVKAKGYPPSVREIAEAVGLSSPSTVHTHMQVLEDKGYIRRELSKPRALELTELAEESFEEVPDVDDGTVAVPDGVLRLPLVGRVAAGTPILAEQNVEAVLPLPEAIIGREGSFVLRVQGYSMVQAGIYDGDFVIVKQQCTAENGEIVVALIDDEATVKTFYREPDRIRLQPENDSMEPIYAENPMILGKVVALIRSM